MKKTLVALAALAATGASFAQVTITGNLTSGYQQNTTNAYSGQIGTMGLVSNGVSTPIGVGNNRTATQNISSGFGVDTAEVVITAKEDLGGGQSVEAKMGLENMARGGVAGSAFGPGDYSLSYTNTSFGRIEIGKDRGAAVHAGLPSAYAPTIDFDGKLFQRRTTGDYVSFVTKLGPVVTGLKLGEGDTAGLGAGQTANVTQRETTVFGQYADGPLTAGAFYRTYDNTNNLTIFGDGAITKDRAYGIFAGYDAGFAKFGMGYNIVDLTLGARETDWLVGVNVPMGALEVGATYASGALSGVRGVADSALVRNSALDFSRVLKEAEGTATGWSLGAKYNLSKRTSIKANYAAWTRAGYPSFQQWGENLAAAYGTGGATLVTAQNQAVVASYTNAAQATAAANVISGGGSASTAIAAAANAAFANSAGVTGTLASNTAAVAAARATTQAQVVAAVGGANALGLANATTAATTGTTALGNATSTVSQSANSQMGYGPIESQFNIVLTFSF